jgi:hypothetical protein
MIKNGAHGSAPFRRGEPFKTTFTHDSSGRLQIPIENLLSEWAPITNAVNSFNASEEGPRLNALAEKIFEAVTKYYGQETTDQIKQQLNVHPEATALYSYGSPWLTVQQDVQLARYDHQTKTIIFSNNEKYQWETPPFQFLLATTFIHEWTHKNQPAPQTTVTDTASATTLMTEVLTLEVDAEFASLWPLIESLIETNQKLSSLVTSEHFISQKTKDFINKTLEKNDFFLIISPSSTPEERRAMCEISAYETLLQSIFQGKYGQGWRQEYIEKIIEKHKDIGDSLTPHIQDGFPPPPLPESFQQEKAQLLEKYSQWSLAEGGNIMMQSFMTMQRIQSKNQI